MLGKGVFLKGQSGDGLSDKVLKSKVDISKIATEDTDDELPDRKHLSDMPLKTVITCQTKLLEVEGRLTCNPKNETVSREIKS